MTALFLRFKLWILYFLLPTLSYVMCSALFTRYYLDRHSTVLTKERWETRLKPNLKRAFLLILLLGTLPWIFAPDADLEIVDA